ncbi:unnamed protein product [Eretmochelys imbricata]
MSGAPPGTTATALLRQRGPGDPAQPAPPSPSTRGRRSSRESRPCRWSCRTPPCTSRPCWILRTIRVGSTWPGDEFLFEGPGTHIPRTEVEVVEVIQATVNPPQPGHPAPGPQRVYGPGGGPSGVTGEEWLVKRVGAYLPGVFEEVVDIVDAFVLTEKGRCISAPPRPSGTPEDTERRTGREWLVTLAQSEAYIPNVYEGGGGHCGHHHAEQPPVLCGAQSGGAQRQSPSWARRRDCPVWPMYMAEGHCWHMMAQITLVDVQGGKKSFFLQPGESLKEGIQDIYILSEEEGLLLRALSKLEDLDEGGRELQRKPGECLKPGECWLIRGPLEYVPPVEVEVLERRQVTPLGENEGIYVRDIKTGKVRAVIGHTYMLTEAEELWEKELPPNVEALLSSGRDPVADRSGPPPPGGEGPPRDKTRVVSYQVPHNAAVQVYDYRERQARVVLGPELVLLGPDEQFTVLSLSGGRPKAPHTRRSLCLLLGPDFCADIVTIETADHARLQLQLAYNWHFEVPSPPDPPALSRLFSVPDFVGDACKALASRIRGAVASVTFDDFHKNSNRIICSAVFGFDTELQLRSCLRFPQNGLVVSSVDIQSVEPVDQRTRDALQRSVQLAIEITTNSQEAAARYRLPRGRLPPQPCPTAPLIPACLPQARGERLEQEARGRLERQKILDQAEAERARKELLELEALSAAVESTGAARAEAQSKADAARIAGEAAVEQAKLKAEAAAIETESELARLGQAREQELRFARAQGEQEAARARLLAEVEVKKFQQVTEAIGPETLRDIALAGPELQVKLLQGLGLQSALITDGSSPINLFSTAGGLLGVLPRPPPGHHE